MEDTGLRNRNHPVEDKAGEGLSTPSHPEPEPKTDAQKNILHMNLAAAASPAVQKVVAALEKLQPVREQLQKAFVILAPHFVKLSDFLKDFWIRLQVYHPEEFAPAFFGLVMTFFGGFYFTLFAAIEAYRVCGWQTTFHHLSVIYEDLQKLQEANEQDEALDEDGNGIPDCQEIEIHELVLRKIKLALATVDPMQVADALSGVGAGFMAVVATLRIQFAQTVTLGVTIGHMIQNGCNNFISPLLHVIVPEQFRQWIPVLYIYGSRSIGISVAWIAQRYISAFYSSFRGAEIFAQGTLKYCARQGYTAPFDTHSPLFTRFVLAFGALGFIWQMSSGFSLPFPLNILLFPFTILEYLLIYIVGVEAPAGI